MAGQETLTLDLLEVDTADNAIWDDLIPISLLDQPAKLISKKALVQMKSSSTRTKDRLDIEMLLDGNA